MIGSEHQFKTCLFKRITEESNQQQQQPDVIIKMITGEAPIKMIFVELIAVKEQIRVKIMKYLVKKRKKTLKKFIALKFKDLSVLVLISLVVKHQHLNNAKSKLAQAR